MRSSLVLLNIIALSISIIGCVTAVVKPTDMTHSDPPGVAGQKAQVELDIFSGRSNPSWTLSRKDSEILARMIEKLPPLERTTMFSGLGYRGFIVRFQNPRMTGDEIRVYKRVVKIGRDKFLKDTERSVESWLAERARSVLNQNEYEQLKREIGN